MVATLPGAYNTYVQDHAASGQLVVDFSRNISEFALNRYIKLIPVEKINGHVDRLVIARRSADDKAFSNLE